jgi:outer membrane receptor protein involved in Fe transport
MIRKHIHSKLGLLCAAACLTTGAGFAQSSTQGAIAGTVEDATKATIANAVITIHNDGTNAEERLTADASGFFKEPLLEPGTYTLTIKASGFTDYTERGVIVQVGQLTSIRPHLSVTGSSENVVVTAEAPILNFDSPDYSSNLNTRAIDNIPVNNRRWSSLALLTPGVTVDSSGFGLVSVRGISTILNNVEIDGADDNQAYFSEERGRTREAYSTSGAAVREFEVNAGVYPAEYGRAAGGVINSVTKSGTNDIHGEAYFYDRESKFNAFNDQSTITTLNPVTNTNITTPLKPKDIRKIYGFTVGGPIRKDKIFFLYTYDQHSRIFPLSAIPTNPSSFYSLPDAALPGAAVCNTSTGYFSGAPAGTNALDAQACTLAARLGLSSYAAGASNYTAGISALNTDLGLIPRTGYQEINQPKLDYQINSKEHLSLLYNRLRWDSPGGVQTNATGAYALDATGTDFVKLDYGVAKLTSLVKSNISNELLYQYGRELNDEGQYPFSQYTKNNLIAADGHVPYISLDSGTGFNVGSPYYSYRPAYPDERKWQIGDTLYWQHGNHSFKFGTDTVHNYDLANQAQYYEGLFTYSNNIANYLADLESKTLGHGVCDSAQQTAASATATAVGVYPCYTSYMQEFGPTTFAFSTLDYAFFAQDNWKLTPRLTLELGLRYDYETIPPAVSALTAASGTFVPFHGINNTPSEKNNFGPRIGFSFDMFGTGKTVLRGGYGLYYGRITNGNLGTARSTTGSPLAQTSSTVKASNGLAAEPLFPNVFTPAQLSTSALPSAYFLAPNLQNPQVHEIDLQLQQQVGHGTAIQVAYLGSLARELPNFLNVNLDPTTEATVNITVAPATGTTNYGPLGQTTIPVQTFTKYGNVGLLGPSAVNFQAITEYLSNINSSYNAFTVEVQNRSLRSVQFDLNYTWAHSLDFYQNASTAGNTDNWYDPYANARANYGNSSFNIPNRLTGYVLYNLPNLKSHSGWSYLTKDWSLNDTFQGQTTLPFSAGVSGTNSTKVTNATYPTGSPTAIGADWNGNGSVSYVPQLGHNNYTAKRIMVDDVRAEKQFAFSERYHLQIFLQAFNVANHQNVSSENTIGYKLAGTAGSPLAGTATYQANFGTVATTNNSGFSYTPRQLELSGRFTF